MKKYRSLKGSLFLSPSIILILAFAAVLLAFHIVLNEHADRVTSQQINTVFASLSQMQKHEADRKIPQNDSGYELKNSYIVFDDAGTAIHPCAPWLNEQEKQLTEALTDFYRQNRAALESGEKMEYLLGERILHLQMRTFYGYFDGYILFERSKTLYNCTYHILVSSEATPLLAFGKTVTHILQQLMAITLLLALFFLFLRSRRLDHAFRALNRYILLAGKREPLPAHPDFSYHEFEESAEIVRTMSDRIGQAEAAQKQFFSNASHELKTPLMSIQGYAEGMQSGMIADQSKCLTIILQETNKMTALINDILLLSRMESASRPLRREQFDLREPLLCCVEAVAHAAEQKHLALQVELPDNPLLCCGDPSALEHAVTNLLTNALRYAVSRIILVCRKTNDGFEIMVTDDGCGISPEDLPHIFERFYKGSGGKTGIGLAITQQAVQQHSGTITAESRPGRTVFRIRLPEYPDSRS